jgi:flagellar hook-associated protein FlgK
MTGAVDDLWEIVGKQIEGVNDMLSQLNQIVEDANDLIDKFNEYEQRIDDRIDDYANRLKNYIDKVNSLAVRGINSLNNYIQPVMIVNADKLRLVSMIKSQATFVKDNAVTLHPTTYTAEIITPCLKKHLAVTNVYKTGTELSAKGGDATCLSALRAANQGENMNKVLNGGLKTKVTLSGLKEGYTYEIAYSALDYSGNIVTRRYFISH